jgi:putative PEP-CTERM system TPR-repeat lipoprotein
MRYRVTRSILAVMLFAALSACTRVDEAATFELGREAAARGDHAAAIIHFKSVLQNAPANLDSRMALGRSLLLVGDLDGAAIELSRASEAGADPNLVSPLLAQAWVEIGDHKKVVLTYGQQRLSQPQAVAALAVEISRAWLGLNEPSRSKASLEQALQAVPDHPTATLLLARHTAGAGGLAAAAEAVDRVLKSSPDRHDAWHLRGDLHRAVGKPAEARAAYEKALALRPSHVQSHVALVSMLMGAGDSGAVSAQLESMVKAAPMHPVTALMQGEFALFTGDIDKARDFSQKLMRALPDQPSVLMLAGGVEVASGSLTQAAAHYGKVLGANPTIDEARENLATVEIRMGQLSQALQTLKPLLEAKEPSPRALALAGDVQLRLSRFDEAERLFAKAAKLNPGDNRLQASALAMRLAGSQPDAAVAELRQLATRSTGIEAEQVLFASHLRRQEHAQALAVVDAMASKRPSDAAIPELRGIVLQARGDAEAAKAQFRQALNIDPQRASALAQIVRIEVARGALADAEALLRQELKKAPTNSSAQMLLAEVLERGGTQKSDEIRSLLADAVKNSPANVEARLRQIRYSLHLRLFKEAVGQAQAALAVMPADPAILEVAGDAQYRAGDVEQAASTYRRLIATLPDSASAQLRLAEVYRVQGKDEQVELTLRRALEVEPTSLPAMNALVDTLVRTKKRDQALELIRRERSARGNLPQTYVLEASLQERLGNPKAALTALRDGLARVPDTALAVRLFQGLVAQQQEAEAIQFAQGWLRQRPKDTRMQFDLAMVHASRGRMDAAEPLLKEVVAANPRNPMALNALAHVAVTLGKAGALEHARRANEIAPNTPAYMDTMAFALNFEGKKSEALELQKRALELAPTDPNLKLGLAKLLIANGQKSTAREHLKALKQLGSSFGRQPEVDALTRQL